VATDMASPIMHESQSSNVSPRDSADDVILDKALESKQDAKNYATNDMEKSDLESGVNITMKSMKITTPEKKIRSK
jgi:hypothetical protein